MRRCVHNSGAVRAAVRSSHGSRWGDSIPTFVPITPAGGRERLVDAILFFLENQDRLLPLVSSARSRTSAVNTLVRRCALSHPEAEAIMDLRLGQAPRESIGIFRAELREAVLR